MNRQIVFLLFAGLLVRGALAANSMVVRHREGTARGFLVVRTPEGRVIAAGDLIQTVTGDRVSSHLVFRFKDGSVDEESTVYSQNRIFRLIRYHHVQKGPSFPDPIDVSVNVPTGSVTVRSADGGKKKIETEHLELPADLANGLIMTVLKNIQTESMETEVPFLAATPKPRLIRLKAAPAEKTRFSAAGVRYLATHYVVKVDLGGVTGIIAPLIGKQPEDVHVWILRGKAPIVVRMLGQFYNGGPLWNIELTSPVWASSRQSDPDAPQKSAKRN